jgi:5'-methylthioadenosine phosphorylase
MVKVGIIGGSGLDDPKLLENYDRFFVTTPFGEPSSPVTEGKLNGVDVCIIARHGLKHQYMPTNVNNRANIWALKKRGCTHILATTAVGSLQEEYKPGELVFIDQFIDRTTKRKQTFYDKEMVCHIPMADPFCEKLRTILVTRAQELALPIHAEGTVVTIEGPRFSSKAESHMFRGWGADIINMSTVPEVVLAREAGLCYASIAMVTDYDCWREGEGVVTLVEVLRVMKENVDKVKKLLVYVVPRIIHEQCSCREAIKGSVF